jgi:hypothetical protein
MAEHPQSYVTTTPRAGTFSLSSDHAGMGAVVLLNVVTACANKPVWTNTGRIHLTSQ